VPEQPNDDGLVPPLKVMRKRLNGVYSAEGLAGPTRRYVLIVAMLVGLASLPTLAAITAGSTELDGGRSGAMDVPFLPPASAGPVRVPRPDAGSPPNPPSRARGEAQRRKTGPRVSPGRGYGDRARGSGQPTGSGAGPVALPGVAHDPGAGRRPGSVAGAGSGFRPGAVPGANSGSRPGSGAGSGSGSGPGSGSGSGSATAGGGGGPDLGHRSGRPGSGHSHHEPAGRDSTVGAGDASSPPPDPVPEWRLPAPPSGWPVVPDPPDSAAEPPVTSRPSTDRPAGSRPSADRPAGSRSSDDDPVASWSSDDDAAGSSGDSPGDSHGSPCAGNPPHGRRDARRHDSTVHNEATGQRRSDSRRRSAVAERQHNVRSARGADRTHNSHRHHSSGNNRGDGLPTAVRTRHGSHVAGRGRDADDRTGALHRSSRVGRHHADPYQDHQNRW
jgi:hypothetical protein